MRRTSAADKSSDLGEARLLLIWARLSWCAFPLCFLLGYKGALGHSVVAAWVGLLVQLASVPERKDCRFAGSF
jgi:hypothetical protein